MKLYVNHSFAQMYQSQKICSRLQGITLAMDAMNPCFLAGASLSLDILSF